MPDISSDLSQARDDLGPKEAVFGLWRRGAEGELKVCLELEDGCSHQVSLKIVPETGCISELSFKKISGPNVPQALPDFCLNSLNLFTSQACIRDLLFFKVGEEAALKVKLKEVLTNLLFITESAQFDASVEIIQARVKFGFLKEALAALKTLENAPTELGLELIESIFSSGEYKLITTFVNEIAVFEKNARKQLLSRLAELASEHEQEERVCEGIWNPVSVRNQYKLSFEIQQSMGADLAKILIHGAFKHEPRIRGSETLIPVIQTFMEMSLHERTELSNYLVEQGLTHGRLDLVTSCLNSAEHAYSKVNRALNLQMNAHLHDLGVQAIDNLELAEENQLPGGKDKQCKKCLEGISQANALELIKNDKGANVLYTLSCFVPLDFKLVAYTLVEKGGIMTLMNMIQLFSKLDAPLALQIVEAGLAKRLLSSLKSFELTQIEIAEIITKIAEKQQVELLLANLFKLPESALRLVEDELHLLEYRKTLGLNSLRIYQRYLDLTTTSDEAGLDDLCSQINSLVDQVISSNGQDARITLQEYYEDVVQHVFQLHTSYSRFASNEKCEDRTFDLKQFRRRDVYKVSLKEGTLMTLRPGMQVDKAGHTSLERLVYPVKAEFCVEGVGREKMEKALIQRVHELCPKLPAYFVTLKEKIYGAILEALCGTCDVERLKQLVVLYKFIEMDNHQQFVRGSIDTAKKSKNAEYSMLLQLREFFQDQLAESLNAILEEARSSKRVEQIMPIYAKRFARKEEGRVRQAEMNKLNSKRYGLTDKFQDSLVSILTNKEMGALVDGETGSVVPNSRKALALGNLISAEQRKIAKALRVTAEREVELTEIDLSDFSFEKILANANKQPVTAIDVTATTSILNSRIKKLFSKELAILDRELRKYRPAAPTSRRVLDLDCFITKNHTSAHARGVGGVCVASDNPDYMTEVRDSQWSMPNYLQLVLKDALTKRCEGLVLLHYYEDQGKRILTASFNPTSSYLFLVNETDLFKGLLECLVQFAKDNSIDIIACSNVASIRTNRTGGGFEIALNSRIGKVGKRFELSQPQVFSHSPAYSQKTLDILWENAET